MIKQVMVNATAAGRKEYDAVNDPKVKDRIQTTIKVMRLNKTTPFEEIDNIDLVGEKFNLLSE